MDDLYIAALKQWGGDAQMVVAIEEMSELQKELCKNIRGRENREAIAEEIADVRIMLDQMEILHGCKRLAREYKAKKLSRLQERIEAAKER